MKKYTVEEILRPGGIWHIVLTIAIFVYALVVEMLIRLTPFEGMLSQPDIESIARITFVVIGLVNLMAAFILLLRPHLVRAIEGWEQLIVIMRSVGMAFILIYAVLEAIAICGLALFTLTGDRLDFYGFAAISLVSMLLLWTQRGRWDRLIALEQAEMNEVE